MAKKRITIARGDGIGPEIMDATIRVLQAAKVALEYDEITIGEQTYLEGHTSGIRPQDWQTLSNNKIFLKSPITTPQGGSYKSLNVTIRKTLGLFANVRPTRAFSPFVPTNFHHLDVVVVRENEEDLYAGIEHRQTPEVTQCLKLISRPGCEKIVRYAFEYAKAYGRKKVTCMSKDNIMKITDGLFHQVFEEVAKEFPDIESNHFIIDIGTARLATRPEIFDVIVTSNLYGDIISDVASDLSGSVGLGGSYNLGAECAMFEAIHGSAPDIAGKNLANPSGLLNAAVLMLYHLGHDNQAQEIANAWLKTLEDGVHTADIYNEELSSKRVGTREFADEVASRLGQKPKKLKAFDRLATTEVPTYTYKPATPPPKLLDGADFFIYENHRDPDKLAKKLQKACENTNLSLLMITNRGVKVWPDGNPHTFCTDHWRCRFMGKNKEDKLSSKDLCTLYQQLSDNQLDVIKTENLYQFAGKPGYSLGQGQ